jgi:hypothetical protein
MLFTNTLQKWWGTLVANGQLDPSNQFNDVAIGNWAQVLLVEHERYSGIVLS